MINQNISDIFLKFQLEGKYKTLITDKRRNVQILNEFIAINVLVPSLPFTTCKSPGISYFLPAFQS